MKSNRLCYLLTRPPWSTSLPLTRNISYISGVDIIKITPNLNQYMQYLSLHYTCKALEEHKYMIIVLQSSHINTYLLFSWEFTHCIICLIWTKDLGHLWLGYIRKTGNPGTLTNECSLCVFWSILTMKFMEIQTWQSSVSMWAIILYTQCMFFLWAFWYGKCPRSFMAQSLWVMVKVIAGKCNMGSRL